MYRTCYLFFLVILNVSVAFGQLRMPTFFADNMVLQQQSNVSFWGSDKPNTTVWVRAGWGAQAKVKTDNEGSWKVQLKTPAAGGPYEVNIIGSEKKNLTNVLIGEVWICSGQSNMYMPLVGYNNQPVLNGMNALLESDNSSIRLFQVEREASLKPEQDVKGEWQEANIERASNFSAVAYLFAQRLQKVLKVPIGVIHTSWGGSSVEAWMDAKTLSKFDGIKIPSEIPEKSVNQAPSLLYNAMMHPFEGFGIKGAIWYQGESNVGRADTYQDRFSAMIASWRDHWGIGDFPFYFVQIAPYDYGATNSAFLREAQLKTLQTVPNTGMAVTMDIGACKNIHPPEKILVAERLAYWALAKSYSIGGVAFSGPEYQSMTVEGNQAKVFFNHAGNGLSSFGKPLSGFEVAGEDRKFYPAEVRVNGDKTITVSSAKVAKPVAVRYAFDNCTEGTLYNNMGLPASSFRTDNW